MGRRPAEKPNAKHGADAGGDDECFFGGMHPYAEKLPRPRLSGDDLVDGDAMARHDLFKELISECLMDDSHVPVLYSTMKKRKDQSRQAQGVVSDHRFVALTTLRSVERDYLVEWIVSVSDLTLEDLGKALRYDTDAAHILTSFATQIPMLMRIAGHCIIKAVLRRVLNRRDQCMGQRLKTFKARGGLQQSGALNFAIMCYRPVYVDNMLARLVHCSGLEEVVEGTHITDDWVIHENWADYGAYFKRDPMPPVKMCCWFNKHAPKGKDKAAIFKSPPLTAACKVWLDLVSEEHAAWEKARSDAAKGSQVDKGAVEVVKVQINEKRKAQAATAREKAVLALSVKRERRSLVLGSNARSSSNIAVDRAKDPTEDDE